MPGLMGIGIWAHLAACASRDETSPGPTMDYGSRYQNATTVDFIGARMMLQSNHDHQQTNTQHLLGQLVNIRYNTLYFAMKSN